jgi:probable HAF family extracellular repeat protein
MGKANRVAAFVVVALCSRIARNYLWRLPLLSRASIGFGVFLLSVATALCSSPIRYSVTVLDNSYPGVACAINDSGIVVGSRVDDSYFTQRAFLYDGAIHRLNSFLPSPDDYSEAYGINSSGKVTGTAQTSVMVFLPNVYSHAFIYDGTLHDIGTLGGWSSAGNAINAGGEVTGVSTIVPGPNPSDSHAFLFDGSMHDLGTLGGSNSQGNAINDSGQVCGWSQLVAGNSTVHGFVYDGSLHDIGTLGGPNSEARGINNSGQLTGDSDIAGNAGRHAFMYDGAMHDLGTLGGANSYGLAINQAGEIVGDSQTSTGTDTMFLWTKDTGMVDLNTLIDPNMGVVLNTALGINDFGQIVGDCLVGDTTYAVLLTPVPEPSTFLLAVLAGLMVGGRMRRVN